MNLVVSYTRVAALPAVVRGFCHSHGGWVVGSGAAWLLGLGQGRFRDWDVLVPLAEWPVACKSVPEGTPTNSQGGLKVALPGGMTLDVWGDDLARFLGQVPDAYLPAYAVHPRTMTAVVASRNVRRHEETKNAVAD
jgi:hypothetical protein